MKKIAFISGSSRIDSVNWRLVGTTSKLAETQLSDQMTAVNIDVFEQDLPRFEMPTGPKAPLPDEVERLRTLVKSASGIFLSSDEYTGAYSTAFRNAAAWLSADIDSDGNLLLDKPIALCGTFMGGVGALRGHPALAQFLFETGAQVRSYKIPLGTSVTPFDVKGKLLPEVAEFMKRNVLGDLLSWTQTS